ncbi:multidrug transporter [Massilia sp. Root351]|uniref:bestrophin family protein n=1 Tax=Massilia sp. Root351 TaxID=1736522 RepID=UPI00070A2848|nr:bestrophin family ion channel [Massilia sp. Root351]KQV90415.1 multidrug transporter [Massilia sp. Root351]
MHIGRSYGLAEFLRWTRRKTYILLALSTAQVAAYELLEWRWLAMPWAVAALLGTAASFIVGFKNAQTYNRTLEAQQVWSSLASISRYWGLISRDFTGMPLAARELVQRHLAWLACVRYQLRSARVWEAAANQYNFEYRARCYTVAEHDVPLESALRAYLPEASAAQLARSRRPALTLIGMQSSAIKELFASQAIPVLQHAEMQKTLKELIDLHSRAERIKNFPYPRQYAIVHTLFVWLFAALLPLGVVREFDKLNEVVGGALAGHMAWLAIPFSVLVAWMYVALDQVGESTENPFEGGANDVPVTHICRQIEGDLRELLGEEAPPDDGVAARHAIIL